MLVDDQRLPLAADEQPADKKVRLRWLGCDSLTAAIESEAATLDAMIAE